MPTESQNGHVATDHSVQKGSHNSVKKPIQLSEYMSKGPRETTTMVSKTPSTDNLPPSQANKNISNRRVIQNLDILKYIISTMAGKDKLAKLIKYTIDLIRIHVLSSEPSNHYHNHNHTRLLLKPLVFFTTLLRSIISPSSADWVSQQLSIFRYALRFGGTPFRIIDMVETISNQYKKHGLDPYQWNKFLLSESTIRDGADIYYGIFDELDMLYKLKLLSLQNSNSQKIYQTVTKHESIAWGIDILLNLNQNYKLLQINHKTQVELTIKLQTQRLLTSTTNSHHNASSSPSPSSLIEEFSLYEKTESIRLKLIELQNDAKLIKLDLARLSMDLIANSSDLFHWDRYLPRGSYAAMSLISGSFNIYKYWCVSKKHLETI